MTRLTRRGVLAGSAAIAAGSFSVQVRAAPEAQKITTALIEAAKKEGRISWYTSVDLPVAEKIAKAFEAAYPGVSMKVERSGAERIFQRIGQEAQSKIYNCDVVNSSDAAHLIIWKRDAMLASYLPEEVAKHFPKEHWDPDGMYASWRVTLSPIAYNTSLAGLAGADPRHGSLARGSRRARREPPRARADAGGAPRSRHAAGH